MASEEGSPPRRVVLDANLLHPFHMRNLLVQLGVDAVIAPRWTARIHAEWIVNLTAAARVPSELLMLDLMNSALPEADVQGGEAHREGLMLPDPDDRHVLAAALASGVRAMLTVNLRDFPAPLLAFYGVVAVHPDEFLCGLHDADPELARRMLGMDGRRLIR